MGLLTIVVSFGSAAEVDAELAYLRAVAPDARFAVCYTGPRSEFGRIADGDSLYVDDPALRGPHWNIALTEVLRASFERFVRDDPTVELVWLIDYDHIVLRPEFERELAELAERSGAGLIAKSASPRNDTNWRHYLPYRDDTRFNDFIASVSTRDDADIRYGCLGTGMLFRRDALQAFAAATDGAPVRFVEVFVPTLVYHLGFEVADVGALSGIYAGVRYRPEFDLDAALAAKRQGLSSIHPFKALDRLPELLSG